MNKLTVPDTNYLCPLTTPHVRYVIDCVVSIPLATVSLRTGTEGR